MKNTLKDRILILDGAMGTMLQRHGLSGNSESFNLSHPQVVRSIHDEYIAAGADIIETNSFSANRISQSEYGLAGQAAEMALAAARIAREAADSADRKIWVAGSMGPSGKSLTLAQDLSDPTFRPYSFDEMADAYEEQICALAEGGVDLLLLETCIDALNTKAAIYAIERSGIDLPLMISLSVADRSGRNLTGQTPEAFFRAVAHAPNLISFGLNCSFGPDELEPMIGEIASWAPCAVSCYPNAGLPNEMGGYDETPEHVSEALARMARKGLVNIVGGCCGTTPEHIRAIAAAVRGVSPRPIPAPDHKLHVSGLEAVTVDKQGGNFTNIGERTNVAGSRKFAKLIAAGDYETALHIAADQIEGGASIIDINMDDAMLDSPKEMCAFLRHISGDPAVAKAALMIDSSHWETILAGLKNAQGKCIVNSISLKEGEAAFLSKAREIKALGAAVVVMAFDEEGQATVYGRKIAICERAYKLLLGVGFAPEDIIFDVNVLSVGTGIAEHSRYGIDFIEAVRWIKANLPGALTSGGISNLSFAFRGNNAVREAMHSVFLYHAGKAGLDMGIVNPSMLQIYDEIEPTLLRCCEDVILDSDPQATERLIVRASQQLEDKVAESGSSHDASDRSVEERLIEALVKGRSDTLEADVSEALRKLGKAVDVIEGPLMSGMEKVGQLFGEGKMFLPQVVKSAKIMRDAVGLLQPYMDEAQQSGSSRPRITIATVKGDVHDIGKNITAIVLRCNGFEVSDLGVMVPKEEILRSAEGATCICASGLITPSLRQMEELCDEMAARGMNTPLIVGGATTSALHTAVKLATRYDHVFHGQDASATAVLASRLLSEREATEKAEHEAQERLRELYAKGRGAAKESPLPMPYSPDSYLRGRVFDDIAARRLGIAEILPYFDWRVFHSIWGIKAGEETGELDAEARAMIEEMKARGECEITLCARFDEANSQDGTIICDAWKADLPQLAAFVAPSAYGFRSPVGMFAISVHGKDPGDSYKSMLSQTLRMSFAEAASCWLDAELTRQLADPDCKLIKPAIGYPSCPDHSLKAMVLDLLPEAGKLGIRLTESYAMIPDASICGFVLAHPQARYTDSRSSL